jgi:hypothetical protein
MSFQLDHDQTGQAVADAELGWALDLRSNVLIIGARETDLPMLRARMADAVTLIGETFSHDLAGTCIVPDALRLTRDQQKALRERLEEAPGLRLVTLSSLPLYPLVESGGFDPTLYYRLNTVMILLASDEAADCPEHSFADRLHAATPHVIDLAQPRI